MQEQTYIIYLKTCLSDSIIYYMLIGGYTMKNNIYKHYKGGIYNLIDVGEHADTKEKLAIYEDVSGQVWIKPLYRFMEHVRVDGELVPRFENIGYFSKNSF